MRLARPTPRAIVSATLFGASAILAFAVTRPGTGGDPATDRGAEIARLRAHFDSVERELLARDVSALTPEQRVRRLRQIRTLDAYRERGVFPRNRDFPGQRVPYFVDASGTLCAVAHLLATSGRRDVVDRVAAERNNAYVAELADDTALVAWLDSNGLTLEEAARIQAPYVGPPPGEVSAQRTARDRVDVLPAALAGGLGAAAIVWNARSSAAPRSPWRSAAGIAAGALGLALGARQLDARRAPLAAGIANAAIGAASAGLATRNLLRPDVAPDVEAADAAAARRAPAVSVGAGLAARDQVAPSIALSVRF